MSKQHHTKPSLKNYRRKLRNNATPAERFLWKFLKSKQVLGLRFQRQHSIDNYIVDFYCASLKLVIELDGEVHNNPLAEDRDQKRDQFLEKLGYTLLRFENKMAFENVEDIIGWIQDVYDKKKDTKQP